MQVKTTFLDVNQFRRDLMTLVKSLDGQALNEIEEMIHSSGSDICTFLKNLDSMRDKHVQEDCRRVAVAQMYGAQIDSRRGYPYVNYCNSWVLSIDFGNSTAIVSKYGYIIFDEGEIWTNLRGIFGARGCFIRKVIDGKVSNKYGFITPQGARVLPCVFDYIDQRMDYCYAIIEHIPFELIVYGEINSIDNETMQDVAKYYDSDCCYYISDDGVLFRLTARKHIERNIPQGEIASVESKKSRLFTFDEAVKEVASLLAPFAVTKEKLQQLLKSN